MTFTEAFTPRSARLYPDRVIYKEHRYRQSSSCPFANIWEYLPSRS